MLYQPSKAVRDAYEKLAAVQKRVSDVFDAAGEAMDLSQPKVLETAGNLKDSAAVVAQLRSWNDEAAVLVQEYETKRALDEQRQRAKDFEDRHRLPVSPLSLPGIGQETVVKGLGSVVVGSRSFKDFKLSRTPSGSIEEGFGLTELKANFVTSSGWAPESLRIPGLVIEAVTRPIQLLDIIPSGTTDQAVVKYMEETTRTHAAAERAEAGAYAESTFALTEQSSTVRSIGDSIPVSDEQLEDVAGAESYLNQRLTFGVRQRLDQQVFNGNGTAPNLRGILNVSGLQTQAKGADPAFDAIGKAIQKVQVTGRAMPTAIAIHPTDWWNLRLTRTSEGVYILGNPADAAAPRLFGLLVAQTDAGSAGTALVGDFVNFCQLFERRGVEIEVGYVGTQFTSGMRTIRAGLRVAFAVYRGAAFCQVTGL